MSSDEWSRRLELVTSYVEEHVSELESPKELAEIVDVSYETLRKRFRREKEIPIGKYIRQQRIDRARELLLETNDPVYVVCWRVGFSSDSNGIRAFKRCTGMTMGEYRRKYRNDA